MIGITARVGTVGDGDLDEARLTSDERSRVDGFRNAADRERFVATANLLRSAIAAELGTDRFVVDRTCPTCARPHGRPRVPGSDLEVSVAHRDDVIAVATSWRIPVGIDVERVGAVDPEAFSTVTSDAERHRGTDAASRTQGWARKEAILKAIGSGFGRDPRQVTAAPDGSVVWSAGGPAARWADLEIADVVGGDHIGAVAWLSGWPCDVSLRNICEPSVAPRFVNAS